MNDSDSDDGTRADRRGDSESGSAPLPQRRDYDVFVSYSHRDQDWVAGTLLPRLEGAGIKVCVDYRDFTPGKASLYNMRDAVNRSGCTLLIMTPDWLSSKWATYEGILARTDDPNGLKRRTIPLLRQKCDIPEDISFLTYIDFTRADRIDLAWRQLLTALGAPPVPPRVEEHSREPWLLAHAYAMPPFFTGRLDERAMLTSWLTADAVHALLVLRALGGFGKSALAWHWLLNDVPQSRWPRVVWWSFYERDARFEDFLEKALGYLMPHVDARAMSQRDQLEALFRELRSSGTLLVLDGFERALRAFGDLDAPYRGDDSGSADSHECDCVSPLADVFLRNLSSLPHLKGKVLLTSRLRPASVEARGGFLLQGCREENLVQLLPEDVIEFVRAHGIRGSRPEIEAACEPYDGHPLSLALLIGLIISDLVQPGDIAAAGRLDVSGDLIQRQHHVLQQAYESLQTAQQALLSRAACFRGPVTYDALKALDFESPSGDPVLASAEAADHKQPGPSFDANVQTLATHGLMHRDIKNNRFDLHPIVRRYAYDRLTAPDRERIHGLLRDYFTAFPAPEHVTSLDDLAPVIELFHHTVRCRQYDQALTLFHNRINQATYYQLGAYLIRIELLKALFPDGEDRPPRLKEERTQIWTLNALAISYSLSGQPRRAVAAFEQAIAVAETLGMEDNLTIGLANIATQQLDTGALRTAEINLRRSIMLARRMEDEFKEASAQVQLGRLLAYRGAWVESETALSRAANISETLKRLQSQCVVWTERAFCELLQLRCTTASANMRADAKNVKSAIASASRAIELADEISRTKYSFERDYIRAHWLLGAARRLAGELDAAEHHFQDALDRCRRINNVEHEAAILVDMARLRTATGEVDDAQRLAEEALVVTERSGYVLQSADAHVVLAELATLRHEPKVVREHALRALHFATCDGSPDYTYKAAWDEASALLGA